MNMIRHIIGHTFPTYADNKRWGHSRKCLLCRVIRSLT